MCYPVCWPWCIQICSGKEPLGIQKVDKTWAFSCGGSQWFPSRRQADNILWGKNIFSLLSARARFSSVVEHLLMVWWVVRLIPIELNSLFNQCFSTGVITNTMYYHVGQCIYKIPCCYSERVTQEVAERSLMVRWVVGSILHGVDPLSYFSFQPVLHDWCNKAVVCVILSVGWCI